MLLKMVKSVKFGPFLCMGGGAWVNASSYPSLDLAHASSVPRASLHWYLLNTLRNDKAEMRSRCARMRVSKAFFHGK